MLSQNYLYFNNHSIFICFKINPRKVKKKAFKRNQFVLKSKSTLAIPSKVNQKEIQPPFSMTWNRNISLGTKSKFKELESCYPGTANLRHFLLLQQKFQTQFSKSIKKLIYTLLHVTIFRRFRYQFTRNNNIYFSPKAIRKPSITSIQEKIFQKVTPCNSIFLM